MKRLLKALISLIGFGVGVGVAQTLRQFLDETGTLLPLRPIAYTLVVFGIYLLGAVLFAFLFFLISEPILRRCEHIVNGSEAELRTVPMMDILFGCLGMLLGLLMAMLISRLLDSLMFSWLSMPLSLLIYIVLASLGALLFYKRWRELPGLGMLLRHQLKQKGNTLGEAVDSIEGGSGPVPKVLDTSVIIDGRIFDICATGFMEGPLVIPGVVLSELRHIADASDALKRNRGRRGLDILQRIQKELDIEVRVDDRDFEDVAEVDVKILRLAQALGGCVVTNDYNLNKVAGVSGIKVLNVNDLANAVKPVAIPGEEMQVLILKEGKEPGQGVAYLDDGTMIVIDSAKRFIGERVSVVVTSVLQTSAGRMIFAKLKNA